MAASRVAVEPGVIHGNADDLSPHGAKQSCGCRVTGILHPDAVARIEHHARDQVERLLGSGGNDDFISAAFDTARGSQMRCKLRP